MINTNNLYKFKKIYSKQPWYNEEIYTLVQFHENRCIKPFGYDCEWANINTGEIINNWNTSMEKLPIDEARSILINKIIM